MFRLAGVSLAAAFALAPAVPHFGPPQQVGEVSKTPQFAGIISIAAADFTGDGLDDLLVTRATWPTAIQYPVQLLVNDGHGGLVNQTDTVFAGHVPETEFPYRVVVADFNGDKVADAFIADTGADIPNPPGYQSQLILSAAGGRVVDGTAGLPQDSAYTYFADAADVNGDGTIDLYIGNTQSRPPKIYLNDGTAHFHVLDGAIPGELDPPANPTTGRFADVNRDGFPDLIVAGSDYSAPPTPFTFPPNTFVLLNDHHGHFSILRGSLPKKPFAQTGEAIDMKTLDLNGDGNVDAVISWTKSDPYYHGRWLQVLIGNGDGTFRDETATRLPQTDNFDDAMTILQMVDLNRDGAPDITSSVLPENPPPFDPPPPFYLNDGHGNFTPLPPGDEIDAGEVYAFGDFDGDGGHDVVYSKDAFHFLIRRELGAPVSTLYATLVASATLLTSEGLPPSSAHAGAYNLVVDDRSKRDGFRITGPGANAKTGAGFTGRAVLHVRLRAGATYRYYAAAHPRQASTFRVP